MNYGCKVHMFHKFHGEMFIRNITEIHYNYGNRVGSKQPPRIAIESNIHSSGGTYEMSDVIEFETELETEIAASAEEIIGV